jgi:hypothetical protein
MAAKRDCIVQVHCAYVVMNARSAMSNAKLNQRCLKCISDRYNLCIAS